MRLSGKDITMERLTARRFGTPGPAWLGALLSDSPNPLSFPHSRSSPSNTILRGVLCAAPLSLFRWMVLVMWGRDYREAGVQKQGDDEDGLG